MKRIAVVNELRPGGGLAHAINVIKTAGGFARLGHEVTVLCRAPEGGKREEGVGAAYREPMLRWRFAPEGTAARPFGSGDPAEAFGAWATAQAIELGADLVYARHFHGALAASAAGLAAVLETHAHIGDQNPLLLRAFNATARHEAPLGAIVTISRRLADDYIARGADARRVAVVPDGVDVEMFTPPPLSDLGPAPFERREGERHAIYTGHLYDYKGIPTVIAGAALLPGVRFHLVGGLSADVERARGAAARAGVSNVAVHGPRPYAEVPRWLWHADVLLLPPSADHPSAAWTSPVKLGEYLAAGPPIVASDITGLRDWVGEPAVGWFRADSPADLARAVVAACAETGEARGVRRRAAGTLARRFGYQVRAGAIMAAAGLSGAAPPA